MGPTELAWRLLLAQVLAGGPNGRLGLVQAQHSVGALSRGDQLGHTGLLRVRIPAAQLGQGEAGWSAARFPDGWWLDILRRLGVPVKVVMELSQQATAEQHAAAVALVGRRFAPWP